MATGKFTEGIFLHFCASMISGLVTTAASMPVDIAKTRYYSNIKLSFFLYSNNRNYLINFRIQNMKISADGKPEYKGAIDVLTKVVRHEGVLALWKGFTPYYCRLGPHTVITFILLEQMNTLYNDKVMGGAGGKSGL